LRERKKQGKSINGKKRQNTKRKVNYFQKTNPKGGRKYGGMKKKHWNSSSESTVGNNIAKII